MNKSSIFTVNIEKEGTGIEKEGTGIEKEGTGIKLLTPLALATALSFSGIGYAEDAPILDNMLISSINNQLNVTWHVQDKLGQIHQLVGQAKLQQDQTQIPLYELELTQGYPTLKPVGQLKTSAGCGLKTAQLELIGFDNYQITVKPTDLNKTPEWEGTGSPEWEGTGSPEWEGTGSPEWEGTGSPEWEGTGSPEWEGTGSPEWEGTGSPEWEGTGSPEWEGTGSPEWEGTGSPEWEGTGSPEWEGTGSPEWEGTGSPEWEGTGGIQPVLNTGSVEILINLQCNLEKGEPLSG